MVDGLFGFGERFAPELAAIAIKQHGFQRRVHPLKTKARQVVEISGGSVVLQNMEVDCRLLPGEGGLFAALKQSLGDALASEVWGDGEIGKVEEVAIWGEPGVEVEGPA